LPQFVTERLIDYPSPDGVVFWVDAYPDLLDQLTAGLIVTDTMHEALSRIEQSGSARLRLVGGPAGSGESTLLALFIRPRKANTTGANIGVADDTSRPRRSSTAARRWSLWPRGCRREERIPRAGRGQTPG
jgi:hypothetical protein